jgi:hypothetical protein
MQPVNVSDSSSNANNVFPISISFATMSLVRAPDPIVVSLTAVFGERNCARLV